MNNHHFDTVARDTAAAVSRRTSLLAIGGAALTAAMAQPASAKRGNSRNTSQKRCKTQTGQCLAAVAEYCAPLELPQVCEAFLGPCCEKLAQCDAGRTVSCLLSIAAS